MNETAEDIAREFSISSNAAIQIRIRDPNGSSEQPDTMFHPAFTYPIFGDEEVIFGYKGLKVELDFTPKTMKPRLSVSWAERFQQIGDVKAVDVEDKLRPYLPKVTASDQGSETSYTQPPGECIRTYFSNGHKFQIWVSSLADARTREIIHNMQILILFFIEGGSFIDLSDPPWTLSRWRVFFLYEVLESQDQPGSPTYCFAGYSTTYRLFFLDKTDLDEYTVSDTDRLGDDLSEIDTLTLPARERISQFLITPPYQSGGHGSQLYNTIVANLVELTTIKEITVEDPNEAFDDMRDVNDLVRLRKHKSFVNLAVNSKITIEKSAPIPISSIIPHDTLNTLRRKTKTANRQFARIVEMHTLSKIPPLHRSLSRITRRDRTSNDDDRAYFFWRLMVKERLYRHNKEVLIQLDLEDRLVKLEETVGSVERDYLRLLSKTEDHKAKLDVSAADEGDEYSGKQNDDSHARTKHLGRNGSTNTRAKRKIIDEDEDEEASPKRHKSGSL